MLLGGNDYAIEENVSYTPYVKDKTELYHITGENSIAVLPKQQGNYMDYEPSDNSALIKIDLDGAGITYSIPEGITLNNSIFLDSDDDPKTDYLVFTGPVPYKTAVFELIPNCSVPVYAFRESLGGGYDMTGSGRFDFVVNDTILSFEVEVSIIKGRAMIRFNRTSGSGTPADDYNELWKLLHKQNIIPETIIPYLNV